MRVQLKRPEKAFLRTRHLSKDVSEGGSTPRKVVQEEGSRGNRCAKLLRLLVSGAVRWLGGVEQREQGATGRSGSRRPWSHGEDSGRSSEGGGKSPEDGKGQLLHGTQSLRGWLGHCTEGGNHLSRGKVRKMGIIPPHTAVTGTLSDASYDHSKCHLSLFNPC